MFKKIMLGIATGTMTVAVAFGLVTIKSKLVPEPIRDAILVYHSSGMNQEFQQDESSSTLNELISNQLTGLYMGSNTIIWDLVDDDVYNGFFDDYIDKDSEPSHPVPDVDLELDSDNLIPEIDVPESVLPETESPELEYLPPQLGGDGVLPDSEELPELEYIPPQLGGGGTVLPDDGAQPEIELPDDGAQPELELPDDGAQPELELPDDGAQPELELPDDGAQPEIVLPSDGAQPDIVVPTDGV